MDEFAGTLFWIRGVEPVTLDAIDANGRGLTLRFVWHIDRFAHTLALVQGDRQLPLLASEESRDDLPWPASPPLKNLTVEERTGSGRVILLVGMAGSSHWSVAVHAVEQPLGFLFDVACRLQEPPGWLGSQYRTMVEPATYEPQRSVRFSPGGLTSQLEVMGEPRVPFAELQTTESGLSIAANGAANGAADRLPATLRWKYRVSLL